MADTYKKARVMNQETRKTFVKKYTELKRVHPL